MPKPSVPSHYAARIKQLQARLREAELSALLVTNARDIRYLTGFVGEDSWCLIPARGGAGRGTILSDFRFDEHIELESPWSNKVIRKKSLADELAQIADRKGYEKIALQQAYLTWNQRKILVKALSASRIKPIDDGLLLQRAVKDEHEIKLIRKAVKIQQQAFREAIAQLEPGQTENEFCAFLEYRMRALGAEGPGFSSIVAADANASLCHAIPGQTKIKKGGILLVDWGACYGGYRSDMTRVVALGKMKPKLQEIYKIVEEAYHAGVEAIKPGVQGKDVDIAARSVIEKAGYGDRFGHSLGHGIGLNIHEAPSLAQRGGGERELEPGHVVTVEPGIYLPGIGGVRLENDVLVTPKGKKVLCDLPLDLESAII